MNALLEARPSTAAAKSRLSVLTTLDSPDSNSATLHAYALSSSTPASNGAPAGGINAGSSLQQLARPGTPGTPSRSSYAIVASELLAASSPHVPASPNATKTDRTGLLNSPASSSSPTAAQVLGAAAGTFDRMVSGKVLRARTSLVATQPAGLSTAGPAAAPAAARQELARTLPSRSSAICVSEKATPAAAAAASRVSLATIGLLAAPGAGLLPGSPLADAAAAGLTATMFSSSSNNSTSGAARSSINGRPQPLNMQQQQQLGRVSVAGGAAQLESAPAAWSAARCSLVSGTGQAAALLQITAVPHSGSSSKTAAGQGYIARLHAAQPAAEQSSRVEASGAQTKQAGSAAFQATSRDKAKRVGRVAVLAADAPGPGHYRPQHGPTDKHVPAAHIVSAASSRPHSPGKLAAAEAQQQQQQQAQQQPQPGQQALQQHRASIELPAAAAVGALALRATRGSATSTPRIEECEPGLPLDLQPHRVHARPKSQKGTSSFKAVSREQLQRRQRPASAGAIPAAGGGGGASDAAVDYYREGYDSLTRPRSSRGPVAIFAKQIPRPPSTAMLESSSPAALGPGAYHRSGQLPISYTGADVPGGHANNHLAGGALGFDKYCNRPGSSPAGAAAAGVGEGLTAGAAADWPGLWGWAAAADGCPHQSGHLASTFTCDALQVEQQQEVLVDPQQQQQQQQQDGVVQQKQRPSSRDALAYMRQQFPTDLVDPQQEACGDFPASAHQQQQQQQLWQHQLQQSRHVRPRSGHHLQKRGGAKARPASAGAILTRPGAATAGRPCAGASCLGNGSFTAAAALRPSTAGPATRACGSSSSREHGGVLALQQVVVFGSMGLAPRVKGGSWSTNSRAAAARGMRVMSVGSVVPPASVAVVQPGTELAYDPNPEVLGHMHKTPAWSMPLNRTATSKKWAQAALKAGLLS